MKRQLSLVLALVMILGSFTSVFAAEMPTTEVDKAKFLGTKGVLKGNQYGELKLEDNLKRRDAVVLLSRLYGVEAEAKATNSDDLKFEDITDDFYKGFIAWSVKEDIVEGFSATEFAFNKDVKAQDYATMLLRVLKHDVNGDTYTKALVDAEAKGILEGLKDVENMTTTTRGMAATMTFNALGVEVKGTGKTLAETLGIEMPEPPAAKDLTAKVNDTENLKEVVLELSNAKLANEDALQNANNYKVLGNEVVKAELKGNDVIVLLKDELIDGKSYNLRVRSIDKAINKEYKFVAKDSTSPEVEKVEVLGEYGIKITATEPIKLEDINRGRSFVVDGKNIAMNVEIYGREIVLTPYYNDSFSKDATTLTITGLEDFAGFRSARQEFPIEIVKDEVEPKVVDVILKGNKEVEVIFDKDVYNTTVKAYYNRSSLGNISYLSGRHPVYADEAKKVDTNRVRYTFKDELLRTRTEFTIVDVANHSKVAMEKTTMMGREILDNIEPEIFDHELIEKDDVAKTAELVLYFDKDVNGIWKDLAETEFSVKDHFKLFDREVASRYESEATIKSAKYDTDAKGDDVKDVIVLELEGLTNWTKDNQHDYVLQVENFVTQNSLRNNRMFRDFVEFNFSIGTGFIVEDVEVRGTRDDQITITFNKSVDRLKAEDLTNYIFEANNGARRDVKDLNGKIVTEKNGREVTLILPGFKVADYKTLRILDTIKDKDGARLSSVFTYDFVSGIVNGGKYTMELVAGEYIVTPNKGVKVITLKTNKVGTYVIKNNSDSTIEKVIIDAPKAHVVIDTSLATVEIVNIGDDSLELKAAVAKLILSTKDKVKVFGIIEGMKVTSTVDGAQLKIAVLEADATAKTPVTINKKDTKEVKSGAIENADLQEGAKAEVAKITTSSGAIEFEVADADKADEGKVKAAAEEAVERLVINKEVYKVKALNVTINGTDVTIVFNVEDRKNPVNEATTGVINLTMIIK